MKRFTCLLWGALCLVAANGVMAQVATGVPEAGLCTDACDPIDGGSGGGTTTPVSTLDAAFQYHDVPTAMWAGQSYPVKVTFTNKGSATWTEAGAFRLGSQNPQDNATWGTHRVALPGQVVTGQSVTFSFTVVAPASPGTYNFQWRMVQDGVAWFGAVSTNAPVTVRAVNKPPTVSLTSPANASVTAGPVALTLSAAAADVGGSIASVAFWSNGVLLGTDSSSPYALTTAALPPGSYQLRAVATDNEGAATSSSPVTVAISGSSGSQVSATRTYVYDSYERLCKTINPESGATLVDYDAAGNLAWSAEGQALPSVTCDRSSVAETQKIVRTYDKLNRLLTVTTPGGTADLQQAYYEDGQVKTVGVSNPGKSKVTTSYSYNRRRLLTSESSANGSTLFGLVYAYDANGSLASLTYPDNHVVSFAPDPFGRATRVTGTGGVVYASDVKYDASGAIRQFDYGNGIRHVREGNRRQLPSRSLDSYFNGSVEVKVLDDRYAYDANSNVTDITDAAQNGLTTRGLAYDGLDRLTAAVSPLQWGNATYGYDALDNLRVADQGARQYRYNYDATNRLANIKSPTGATLFTLAYDARGNTTSKNSQAFVFDAVNRMNQVTGSQVYRYDGLGRRVQTTDADGKTTFWIYSQSGQVLYTSEARRSQNLAYIYLGNTQVATRALAWGSGTPTIRYQHTDSLGSPVAETDALRNIVKRNSLTPYGETFGATVIDGTGYTGHVMDRATGLTYMQQRYYDHLLGRFLSIDAIAVDTSGENYNRFWYANNNPYKLTDPDGREAGCIYGPSMCGLRDLSAAQAQRRDQVISAFTGAATDFAPGIGDAKSFVDAAQEPSLSNIVAAGIGLLPVIGDVGARIIKVTDKTSDVGKTLGNLPKPPKGPGSVPKADRDPQRFFTPPARDAKRAEQGGKCPSCGGDIDQSNSAGHHVVRHADGGRTVPENHVELCIICHFDIHHGE